MEEPFLGILFKNNIMWSTIQEALSPQVDNGPYYGFAKAQTYSKPCHFWKQSATL